MRSVKGRTLRPFWASLISTPPCGRLVSTLRLTPSLVSTAPGFARRLLSTLGPLEGPRLSAFCFSEVQPPLNSCQDRSFSQAGSAHRWPIRSRPGYVRRAAEASAVEEGQIQLVEALGIGDSVDLDDLAVPDLEIQHHKEPSTRSHDDPHGAVDERRSRGPGASY
jgi:hypothetical protein